MVSTSDSSSEDDDVYVSAASRLKALKKKPCVILNDDSPTPKVNGTEFWRSKPLQSQPETQPQEPSQHNGSQNSNDSNESNRSQRSLRSRRNRARRAPSPDVAITTVTVIDDNEDDDIIWESKKDTSLNVSQDVTPAIEDDNYNMDIKVKWMSREIVRLELRKYESFQKIFQHFADLEGVSEKQILILRGGKAIHRTDTPASLELKVIDFLEGGIVNADVMPEEKTEDAGNVCKIKVQMSTKQKINVDLKMDETFKTVVMTCAEQLSVSPAQIKLTFDGDEIALTDTPESLDLEQEACIDLRVVG